jgi:acetyl-CoA acetyltransferase
MEQLQRGEFRPQDLFPINTHGGLLAFGAPWEVPAMYNIIEAFAQLQGKAGTRQVRDASRALVYGNGGIFSHSAVAILGNGRY